MSPMRPARRSAVLVASTTLLWCAGCSPPTGRFTPTEAARVCLSLAACLPREFAAGALGFTLDSCTSALAGPGGQPTPGGLEDKPIIAMGLEAPMKQLYRCVLDGGSDCRAVHGCLFQSSRTPEACFADRWLGDGQCMNDRLSGCTREAVPYLIDCGAQSLQCGTTGIINATFLGCSLGNCSAATRLSCEGSVASICAAGGGTAVARFDCSRFGRHCELPRGGTAYCAGEVRCSAPLRKCDGNVAVACADDGFETRWDCARNPTYQRCVNGLCAETGADCQTDAEASFCDGDAVHFCQDGKRVAYECTALGYTGCDAGLCTPP